MAGPLSLPALVASNPLGALASFGLLRILGENNAVARLSFQLQDDWFAQLHDSGFEDKEALITWLVGWISRRETSEIEWSEDVRVLPEKFRELLAAVSSEPRQQSFLTAMAAEGVVDRSKKLVKPSPLYMASGQQSFLGGLREIRSDVREHARQRIEEAILGPWRYETRLHSLGWDPAMERLHALRWREPAKKDQLDGPSCVPGAVWLAFEALPLLPCFASSGRVAASAFRARDGDVEFVWPVFEAPVGLGELKSILQTGDWATATGGLRRGIAAVYSAERYEFQQGYAVFRPAKLSR